MDEGRRPREVPPMVRELRAALEELAELSRDGDIEPGDFEEVMVKRGLMVEVPANDAFKAEHGGDTMLVLRLGE